MFFRGLALLFWAGMFSSSLWASPVEPLLAKTYQDPLDLRQWWVSEKLDGVRAIWDGEQLRFRSGKEISAPAWYVENFPSQPMDGELWMERNAFDQVSAAVRRKQPREREWKKIQYRLFELPGASGTFTQRIGQMDHLTASTGVPWLRPVEQFRIASKEELFHLLDLIVAEGGEGLMLHRADSLYHSGRSDDLLKLKLWQDAEATVIKVLPGKGKYRGMMGALLVENDQGQRFRIGSGFSDQQRRQPPLKGAIITYKYTGTTVNGLPRFVSFLRVRSPM